MMTIQVNRKRFPTIFIIGLLGSILLTFLIISTLKNFDDNGYVNRINLGAYIGLLIVVLALTIITFLEFLKTRFGKSTELTISENGIYDNLSIFSVGNINWKDISDIKVVKALNTNFLVIEVKNPESFINMKSKLKQRTLKSFFKKFGSPIVISQKRVDIDLNELKEKLIQGRP